GGTPVDRDTIDHFMCSLPTVASRVAARTAIQHARRIAPHRFAIQRHATPDPDGPLLVAYLEHLRHVRGLEPKTCEGLLLLARRILAWYHHDIPIRPLAAMTGEDVLALVQHESLYIAEICAAIGVPERTLYHACKDYLRMSPHRYLRLRRMNLVRRALALADP